ncbi:hypothetical protein K432DRAFT_380682 [Lepidopterella palustris CBS 459.81]|uniref:Uncharacterized protein n=1 Tax=Lepidopterella palustris CBS 459.81 TaxID=1314670 RepID=A0A8E2JGX0_9PEZI|nr:hypothetical protein K432DRAFT_380682 [Lepidopterella palustris CBS 459.81]
MNVEDRVKLDTDLEVLSRAIREPCTASPNNNKNSNVSNPNVRCSSLPAGTIRSDEDDVFGEQVPISHSATQEYGCQIGDNVPEAIAEPTLCRNALSCAVPASVLNRGFISDVVPDAAIEAQAAQPLRMMATAPGFQFYQSMAIDAVPHKVRTGKPIIRIVV